MRFWNDVWLGRERFADIFPSVYSNRNTQDAVVEEMGSWTESGWRWNCNWANELMGEDTQNVEYLRELLLDVSPVQHADDRWSWVLDSVTGFTVKRCYVWLCCYFASDSRQLEE